MDDVQHRRPGSEIERHIVGRHSAGADRNHHGTSSGFDAAITDLDSKPSLGGHCGIAKQRTPCQDRRQVADVGEVVEQPPLGRGDG